MSWADDNGLTGWDESDFRSLEDDWKEGFHTTRDGEEMRLEDMTESHLRNTIAFFQRSEHDYDTTPLEQELEGRYGHGIE